MKRLSPYSILFILVLVVIVTAARIPHHTIDANELKRQGGLFYHKDKPYTGRAIEYYPRGEIKAVRHYANGKRQGRQRGYYESGQLAYKRYYMQNRKSGLHLGWWPNGQQKFMYSFRDGIAEGISKEWSESGTLLRAMTYQKGKEDGPQKMWNEDGSIRANYVVKNGRRYGLIGLKNCKSVSNEIEGFTAIDY
ncbi:toxin-antitoxin system YwqK family antitoxin [Roseivirga thermotolerans]|uniref:Toxin-antitoxin system YwqK family antitoxin n=1 Tax=Roseivirga thermotolerans TaxID=1758176 RepID=A0ABQ3ICC5_9BACT|nr:toxin-antitoxin system YwqK family antitoxin [Roseivirga thermotolerans]GHE70529.1 hypothetical protein GCM10011340_27790 [Roseivirga thermotolerans]